MIKIKHIAVFWGILDLLMIAWYLYMNLIRGEVPVISDINSGIATIKLFGFQSYTFLSYIAVLLYLSPIISGILLLLQKRIGLVIAYIQTPFRLLAIIPPSIFFIIWPLNEGLSKLAVLSIGFTLIIISETIKISTLIVWDKKRTT